MEKENNSLNLSGFSLRTYSLTCDLCAGENFSTIFNQMHPFQNLDTGHK